MNIKCFHEKQISTSLTWWAVCQNDSTACRHRAKQCSYDYTIYFFRTDFRSKV